MKNSILAVILILLFGCTHSYNIQSDKTITKIFNQKEMKNIQALIDYSDKLVFSKTNENEINKAYHQYFDMLRDSMFNNNTVIPIDIDERLAFLEDLDAKTINEFWLIMKDEKHPVNLNINGKFMEYLKNIGETDSAYYNFYDNFLAMGDITTSQVILFLSNNDDIDFSEAKHRILAMICLFSVGR